MYLLYGNHNFDSLWCQKRHCFLAGEKKETPSGSEEKEAEKPVGPGISIDAPGEAEKKDEKKDAEKEKEEEARKSREALEKARKEAEARRVAEEARKKAEEERIQREKEEAEKLRKQKLTATEKIIQKRYGGDFYKMADLPGLESTAVKSEFHVSTPDLHDDKFKGKKPRVICWFHQNGGQDYSNDQSKKMYALVEEMRKNGEPVILVMPQDNDLKTGGEKGKWDAFEKPEVFKAMMEQVEKVAGTKIDDITFGSSSGGYKGIARSLRAMRQAGEQGNEQAKKLYKSIKQIGFCDSLYGEEEEVANWAVSDPEKKLFSYSGTDNPEQSVLQANKRLKKRIEELLTQTGKKMGDNIDIPLTLHPAGHDVDPKTLARFMHRKIETLPEGVTEGTKLEPLNFPPRAPDAMTGTQFVAALAQCKTSEEKRKLTVEQASKGAFSRDSMTPQYREASVDGKKIRIPVYTNISFGSEEDKTTLTPDGQTMQILADMLGGSLPPSEFYKNLYGDPTVPKMPFFTGEQLEQLVNERRQKKGLPPLNINDPDGTRNGFAMMSTDYMQAEHDMQEQWLRMRGYKPDQLRVGGRKTVFMPNDNGTQRITFGGGLVARPIRDPATNTIVDFEVTSQIVQGIGDLAHEPTYADYSSGGDMIGGFLEYDGEQVAWSDIKSNPKYAKLADTLKQMGLGKLLNPTKYKYDESMQTLVKKYHQEHPAGSYRPPKNVPTQEPPPSSGKDTPSHTPDPAPSYVAAPSAGGSAPVYGGGAYSGGGPSHEAPGAAPAYMPPSHPEPAQSEGPKGQIDIEKAGKVFLLGDSLSEGFKNHMKGKNVQHVLPAGRSTASGQTAREMLTTLRQQILNQNVEGATLVIVGGSNDIFLPNSFDQIKQDLTLIWKEAKAKGMKVIGATLPPLAHSKYARDWAAKTKTPYEQYNTALIDRWTRLNQWITTQVGAKNARNEPIGPDRVIQLHHALEDPSVPGKLHPDYWNNQDGVHPPGTGYKVIADLLKQGIGELNPDAVTHTTESSMTGAQASQNAKWRTGAFPEGAKPGAGAYVGKKAQELLGQMRMGESQTFTDPDTGKRYIALKEWHTGSPNNPNPHPGVSVAEAPDASNPGPKKT